VKFFENCPEREKVRKMVNDGISKGIFDEKTEKNGQKYRQISPKRQFSRKFGQIFTKKSPLKMALKS